MPDDRLLHKRAGHSEKVTSLCDFDFRVWIQYQWSADDFGVMRLSAVNLQADNDALAQRSIKVVQRAFERVVESGLIHKFEHQGRIYVHQRDWQDFQKVEYPKPTVHPLPPADQIALCSERTQQLFSCHPGGKRSRTRSGPDGESSPNLSLPVSDLAGARSREEAMANGNGLRQEAKGLPERFDRFWAAYPRKVGKDAAWKAFEKRRPDADLTDRMIAAVNEQRRTLAWTKDGGEYIPHPATWLNQGRWQDEVNRPMSQVSGRPQGCRHQPACVDAAACTKVRLQESRRTA